MVVMADKDKKNNIVNSTRNDVASDFEEAIEAAGFGLFNWTLYLIALPSLIACVCESTTMSYILPVAECDLNLTLYDKGILNATGYAGMIVSAILWGYLADTQGRKIVLVVGFLIDTLCSVLSGLSQNFLMLVIFKFLGGIFINGPTATIFAYMSEMHSAQYRSRAIMIIGLWTTIGNLVLPLLGWAVFPRNWSFVLFNYFTINEWQIFLLITSLFPAVSGLSILFLPESPKFLMSQGRNAEALKALQKIYALNHRKPKESYPIKHLVEEVPSRETNNIECIYTIEENIRKPVGTSSKVEHRSFRLALQEGMKQIKPMFTKPLLGQAIHALIMQFCILLGLNTVRLWLPQLFASTAEYEALNTTSGGASMCAVLEYSVNKSALQANEAFADHCIEDLGKNNATLDIYSNNIIVAIAGIVGYMFAGLFIKLLGNRGMTISGLFLSAILGMSLYWSSSSLSTLIISSTYITVGSISTSSLLGVVMALFPTSLRTFVVSMALMFGRMGGLTGNILFPFFMELACLPPFLLVASMFFIAGVLASILPKTNDAFI